MRWMFSTDQWSSHTLHEWQCCTSNGPSGMAMHPLNSNVDAHVPHFQLGARKTKGPMVSIITPETTNISSSFKTRLHALDVLP
jgi:hypothetical protein